MSSEYSIVYQYVKKLGFIDNKTLIEKTNELLRRLESKSIGHITKSSDNAKAVLCIDLASEMLALQLDSKLLLRWSGFGKSEYVRTKRTFEKILDISQNFDIPKICIQLGISHVQELAKQLYNDYTHYASQINNSELDLTHPQYFTMAIYQACKKDKVKVLKSNLIKVSHLKAQQWEKLEQSWNSVMDKSKAIKLLTKSVQENSTNKEVTATSIKPILSHHKEPAQNYINNYNSWKTDLLRKSYKNLVDSKSIDYIDIYILGFILELSQEDLTKSKQLLESYYQCIRMPVNTFVPKYSVMAVYKVLNDRVLENDVTNFLMEYSELTQLEWNKFEKEWHENMEKMIDVEEETLRKKYDEFDKWIVDFKRI